MTTALKVMARATTDCLSAYGGDVHGLTKADNFDPGPVGSTERIVPGARVTLLQLPGSLAREFEFEV